MIEGGVELSNVIVSSNAQIGEGATLKDCMVGPKYQVQAGGGCSRQMIMDILS